ncbi:MAG: shikimate kinase [Lachnospiraceae bacterium]|nr:shikimate kinase [Lachnospiraceae bacterium]
MKGNICLIGYMGSGKTTLGKMLAQELDKTFEDTDALIVDKEKRSIPEIFEKEGEQYFRNLETETLRAIIGALDKDKALKTKGIILSTGGGIVVNEKNHGLLRQLGTVIYLKAGADTLYRRVGRDENRPLLKTEDVYKRIVEMLKIREPIYEKAADIIIETDDQSPVDTIKNIIEVVAL